MTTLAEIARRTWAEAIYSTRYVLASEWRAAHDSEPVAGWEYTFGSVRSVAFVGGEKMPVLFAGRLKRPVTLARVVELTEPWRVESATDGER